MTWCSALGLVALITPPVRRWIHDRLPGCARRFSEDAFDPDDPAGADSVDAARGKAAVEVKAGQCASAVAVDARQ